MKKTISIALVLTFLASAYIPAFAQKGKSLSRPTVKVTNDFVRFELVDATTNGKGVMVRWHMASETHNVGFNVYRHDASGPQLVNPTLVLGAAVRSSMETTYGEKYEFYDREGTLASTYSVEGLARDGRRLSSPTFGPRYTINFDPDAAQRPTVATSARAREQAVENNRLTLTPELANEVNAARLDPVPSMHARVVSQFGAKIAVRKDGLHRVTRAELQATGFNVNESSANWRLFMEGNEHPILVGPGDQYIEFFGKGINTIESDTRVYYLIANMVNPPLNDPKRIQTKVLRPMAGNVVSHNYGASTEKIERVTYYNQIFNGDAENYWGRIVSSLTPPFFLPSTFTFNLSGVEFGAGTATVVLKMHGFTTTEHTVNVAINGNALSPVTGAGQNPFSATYVVPRSFLNEGVNALQMSSANAGELSMFDSLKIDYVRKYQADENKVAFYTPGLRKVDLGGFVSPLVSTATIFDTVPQSPAADAPLNVPASATAGVLRMNSTSFRGGESGTGGGKVSFIISRVYGNTGSVTTDVALTNGTAVGGAACGAGVDFVNPGLQTITIPSGVATKVVDVTLCNDGIADAGETFTATLSNATGGATLAQTNPRVFDTTYDGSAQLISNLVVQQDGGTATVKLPASRSAVMYGIDESYAIQSPAVTANNGSTLMATTNGANMVIISHSAPEFMTAANAWADYRRSVAGGSFTVQVVDVADVFDEVNYGVASADSLKSFLSYAHSNWQTRPQNIMLIGDASHDPRNYEGHGYNNMVPTKMVTLSYEESGSDDALVDFNNDGLAEVAIGRIPGRTAADIAIVFDKTKRFEMPAMQSFGRGALYAWDAPDGWDFEGMSHLMRDQMPNDTVMPSVFVGRPWANSQTLVIDEMAAGKYIVNYAGHGSSGVWWGQPFFGVDNVPQVTNTNDESIFTMLTCFNGYFIRLRDADACIAERLLNSPTGGAAVAWASTARTTPIAQQQMGIRFYNQLAAGNITRMGALVRDAKTIITDGPDIRLSWVLLGDPLLKLRP